MKQLDEVSQHHNGRIPIHGRLFQQWLHYVFPYECPYPSSTSSSASGDEESTSRRGGTTRGDRITKAEYEEFVQMKQRLDAKEQGAKKAEDGELVEGSSNDLEEFVQMKQRLDAKEQGAK